MFRVSEFIMYNVGKLEEAIERLTEAILLNPTSAIMYGTRGNFIYFFHFSDVLRWFFMHVEFSLSPFLSACC